MTLLNTSCLVKLKYCLCSLFNLMTEDLLVFVIAGLFLVMQCAECVSFIKYLQFLTKKFSFLLFQLKRRILLKIIYLEIY